MSSLGSVTSHLQKLAASLVNSKPDRDALAEERDQLLAAPPPAPANTLALPEPQTCTCEHCATRAREEQATRVAFAAWAGRVTAIERQLFKLTFGDEIERDALGDQLAELCHALLGSIDVNKGRQWERKSQRDGLLRPLRTWETAPMLGAITAELVGLYRRAMGPMVYLATGDLTEAIKSTRQQMVAALNRPLETPLDPAVAARADHEPAPQRSAADTAGLVPAPDGNIVEGTIRFSRKGRA